VQRKRIEALSSSRSFFVFGSKSQFEDWAERLRPAPSYQRRARISPSSTSSQLLPATTNSARRVLHLIFPSTCSSGAFDTPLISVDDAVSDVFGTACDTDIGGERAEAPSPLQEADRVKSWLQSLHLDDHRSYHLHLHLHLIRI